VDPFPHPDLAMLVPLLGTWAGEGEGRYPTIEPFRYREQAWFTHVGKPFVAYRHGTVNLATDQPAHAESGYLRAIAPAQIELVLVHPTGIVEVSEGEVNAQPDGLALHLMTIAVPRTPTAKEVTSVERRITVTGDTLRYQVSMGAVGQPHQHHLAAELHRRD